MKQSRFKFRALIKKLNSARGVESEKQLSDAETSEKTCIRKNLSKVVFWYPGSSQ